MYLQAFVHTDCDHFVSGEFNVPIYYKTSETKAEVYKQALE